MPQRVGLPVMTLRSAVVGAGTISGQHLSGLRECPRTKLVAVCDLEEDRARDAAREYDITPYFDLTSLLTSESLDWIHICTPVQSHLPLATQALEAGVPVIIEKPVTETLSEYEQLVAASEEAGVPFSVVHNHIYDPAMRAARSRIENGKIGAIRGVELLYSGLTSPDDHHRGSWVFDLPGGEFAEGLSHPLYLAIEPAGYPASREAVSAQTSLFGDYGEGFAYDSAHVQYVSEDGTHCSIMMLSGNIPQRLLRIHGEHCTLVVDFLSQTLTVLDRDYGGSQIGTVLNSADRIFHRTKDTCRNVAAIARRKFDDSWETKRDLNPNYYLYDVEARALQRGERSDSMERGRWTTTLFEEIRGDAIGRSDAPSPASEDQLDDAVSGTD